MSNVYAGAHAHLPTECNWSSHFDDCYLGCSDTVLPGENVCALHFIAAVHAKDAADYDLRITRRPA